MWSTGGPSKPRDATNEAARWIATIPRPAIIRLPLERAANHQEQPAGSDRGEAHLRRLVMSKRLKELLVRPDPDAREIAEYFDGLALGDAISAVRSLSGRRLQRALWECVSVNATVHVADLVPPDYQPMKPVVFHGKNSLPAFTHFEKICCRPPAAVTADVLWGYNENTIKSVIGPGYYVVHDTESNPYGGSAFDYTMLPEAHPDGWPRIRPNSAGLSRFIYQNTIDYMRRVATRVFIGSATRVEREIGSYFVLVRELD